MSPEKGGSREASPPLPQTRPEKQASRIVRERRVARIGMTAAMGALMATGLMRGRGARVFHIWSGLALIGLSVWHHNLYRRS